MPSGVSGGSGAPDADEDIVDDNDENEIVFGKMALKPGVSKTNVITLFFGVFANKLVNMFIISFMAQLLI